MTLDYLRREADAGRRTDFERYLAAVPNGAPAENDRLDKRTNQPTPAASGWGDDGEFGSSKSLCIALDDENFFLLELAHQVLFEFREEFPRRTNLGR